MKNSGYFLKKMTMCMTVTVMVVQMLAGCGEKEEVIQPTENTSEEIVENNQEILTVEGKSCMQAVEKEETVNVKAGATGEVKEINVETVLKSGSGNHDLISDVADLEDIKNTKGDEAFVKNGNDLFWENHGENISYKGTSKKELPIDVKITYFLDGNETEPEKLAGKTGDIRIRFDYDNKEMRTVEVNGKEVTVHVPFAVMSMVVLPSDVFSDIEVEGGKLIAVDDTNMAVGMCYPGIEGDIKVEDYELTEDIDIKDYFEISAHAEEFELDFTATVISTGTFEDMDLTELDDIEEMPGDMDELKDASGEIVDGTAELYDAAVEFKGYMNDYMEAVVALKEGVAAIEQGTKTLGDNKKALQDGAAGLQAGLEQLNQGILMQGAVLAGVVDAETGELTPSAADKGITDKKQITVDKIVELLNGLLKQIKSDDPRYATAVTYIQLLTQTSALASGSKTLNEGITAYVTGVDKLYEGSQALHSGARQMVEAGNELNDGFGEMRDGIKELADGVKEFDEEGISEVAKLADDKLLILTSRIRALKEADAQYTNFSGLGEGCRGCVRFIIETEEIKK